MALLLRWMQDALYWPDILICAPETNIKLLYLLLSGAKVLSVNPLKVRRESGNLVLKEFSFLPVRAE